MPGASTAAAQRLTLGLTLGSDSPVRHLTCPGRCQLRRMLHLDHIGPSCKGQSPSAIYIARKGGGVRNRFAQVEPGGLTARGVICVTNYYLWHYNHQLQYPGPVPDLGAGAARGQPAPPPSHIRRYPDIPAPPVLGSR